MRTCVLKHTGEGLEGYNKVNIETSFRKNNDHIKGKLVFAAASFMQILCKSFCEVQTAVPVFRIELIFRHTGGCTNREVCYGSSL